MMQTLLLAAALMGGTEAHAAKGPWMWGVGPSLGTIVYPGRFPAKVPDQAVPGTDTTALDGKVRGDGIIGVQGVMYIDGDNRVGSHVDLGFAGGYNSVAWTLEYERIFIRGNGIHVFGGGGLGFGSYSVSDDSVGKLTTPTYELRAQVGLLYKQKKTAEQLSLYAKLPLNGVPRFTAAGSDEAVDADGGGNWFHMGLQATVFFGDWTMPKKKKKNKKKK